jgi:hypothetical protein
MVMLKCLCASCLVLIGAPQVFSANKGVQKQGDPLLGESKRTNRLHILTPPAGVNPLNDRKSPRVHENLEPDGQVQIPAHAIHSPAVFANTEDGVVALLLPPPAASASAPKPKQTLIIPMKRADGYVFLTTLMMEQVGVNRAYLKTGWKIVHKPGDPGFQMVALATGEALGVVQTKPGLFRVEMMSLSARTGTRMYLIQGRCGFSPLRLYNPALNVVIGVAQERGTCRFTATVCRSDVQQVFPVGTALDFKSSKPYSGLGHLSFSQHLAALPNDNDGDGHDAIECGGDDCDDDDPRRFPGNAEVCDVNGVDEDCNLDTFGTRDVDRDGHVDRGCFNRDPKSGEISSRGTDCDDNNPAIVPGVMIYLSDSEIEICGRGRERLPAAQKAVRQPNGTAVVQAR